jgi:methyl-accepting chemotaxis protein
MSLSIRARLSVITVLFLVPIGLMCGLFVRQSLKDIDFASLERQGVAALSPVHDLVLTLAGSTGALAAPDAGKLAAIRALGATPEVAKAIDAVGKAGDVATRAAGLRELATAIGNDSNLVLDPDLSSYYVMDISVARLPDLFGRLRLVDDLVAVAASGPADDEERAALLVGLGELKALGDAIAASYRNAAAGDPSDSVRLALEAPTRNLVAGTEAFIGTVRDTVAALHGGQTADLAAVSTARTALAGAGRTYWLTVDGTLDHLLAERINGLSGRLWSLLGIALGVTLAALILGAVVSHSIVAAIAELDRRIRALADTDIDAEITGRHELGRLAEAVAYFRNRVVSEVSEANQAKNREEIVASQKKALAAVAETLSTSVGEVVRSIHTMTSEIGQASGALTMNAGETRSAVETSLVELRTADSDVDAVTRSVNELAASFAQIAEETTRSSAEAERTYGRVAAARALGSKLAETSARIGEISTLISTIAQQTNLLALNATIEAARAGEAGKGFAVVAAEVKDLASQTAKATEDIERQVTDIRAVADEVVNSVSEITGAIDGMSGMSRVVAEMVDGQTQAVQSINRNLEASIGATRAAVGSLDGLPSLASASESMSSDLNSLSTDLTTRVNALEADVGRLLHELTDRRLYARRASGVRVDGTIFGITEPMTVIDFSASGMRLRPDDPALTKRIVKGLPLALTLPTGRRIVANIVWAREDVFGCQFVDVRLSDAEVDSFGASEAA